MRAVAGAPEVPDSEGRSLLGYLTGDDPAGRAVTMSENWGFAAFETERYRLVVDEDASTAVSGSSTCTTTRPKTTTSSVILSMVRSSRS